MADGTKIEWTEATWNPITGCSLASPGCTNCYAMQLAGTRLKHSPSRKGLTQPSKAGPVWTGEVRFNEHELTHPLRWKRPRPIFVCAHGDLFHESVPDAWIDRIFAVMALCPQHTFQVLTKRSARMREYLARRGASPSLPSHEIMAEMDGISRAKWPDLQWPLPNVWLGVSVEDQQRADERIPDLLATPAAVRWISAEPLLGPVDLNRIREEFDGGLGVKWESALDGKRFSPWVGDDEDPMIPGFAKLDWVVVGGESGSKARPMHPDWARALRDQCAAADVPFFFKQWGEWAPGVSIDGHVTRTEATADWLNDRWAFEEITPRMASELHTDDEPLLWRCGKKRANRYLDSALHDGMPT